MNKVLLSGLLISLLCIACSNGKKEKVSETEALIEKAQDTTKNQEVVTPSDSDTITLNIVDGKGSIQIRKKADQNVCVKFEAKGYKKITAHLLSQDSIANIRISQIILPDGTMDGPFSRDMEYALPSDGIYKLFIHESLMAGDPWEGIFKLDVILSE